MPELVLHRPLAFFDLETTGINVSKDRIVEISVLRIEPNQDQTSWTRKINPEMPIPLTSSEIHGIYDKDVENAPTFKEIAPELKTLLKNCDLGGYNSNQFDVPMLMEEFLRVDIDFSLKNRRLVDVQSIFFKKEPRTLSGAYKFYCDSELDGAHSAEADVKATYDVLKSQLDMYSDLENDIEFLSTYTKRNQNADLMGRLIYDESGDECFNFGKYKHQKVKDVLAKDPSYYSWMMNGDFPLYTKKVLTAIRLKMLNQGA